MGASGSCAASGIGQGVPMSKVKQGRLDVLGVGVSPVNMEMATQEIDSWIASGAKHYAMLTGVHGLMEAVRNPGLRAIYNYSGLSLPDGMPMVWLLWRAGYS